MARARAKRNNIYAVASACEHIVYMGLVLQGPEPHPYAGLNRFAEKRSVQKTGRMPRFFIFVFSVNFEPPMGNQDCAPDMNH